MNTKIAVLLTCYNRRKKTIICLKSLYNSILPVNHELDVFLVDDGSTDDTSKTVKNEYPLVNVILGNGHLFWNRGMHLAWNTAARSYNFDFYIWLNDDVELFPNAILELLTTSAEKNSIVCGTTRSRNQSIVTYGGRDSGKLIIPTGMPQVCNVFNGNLVLIPSYVYNMLGNLNPIFPHTMGDFDYALRARKKGIKSFVAPNFSGYCENNISLPLWCLPEVPFLKRFKVLYSPLGNSHPYYYFRFEKQHYGIFVAIKHFCSIHLRLLFPRLWK